jgi:hypothetical protein
VLEAEGIMENVVSLEPVFSIPVLAQALKAENLQVAPASVSLRGPESEIRKIQRLKLDVPLEPAAMGDYQLLLPVTTPAQVTATPGAVLVRYSIAGVRVSLELEREPLLDAKISQPYLVMPQKMTLTVELPAGLKDDKRYLEKIRVVIDAKDLPLAASGEVKPSVELPPGARLVNISPGKLEVTKDGK